MGNTNSADNSPVPLAMMAVAREIHFERGQIVALRNAMAGYADEHGIIHRKEFNQALELTNLVGVEIFELLFTLWDNEGHDEVPFRGFCVGISPLACPYDDVTNILRFALRICDDRNLGYTRVYDLQTLLNGINSTASYFGDVHLSTEEIAAIIESTFDGGIYKIVHEDCIRRLASNAYIKRFASGKTRMHVHFKKELVTEIQIQPRHDNYLLLSPRLLLENRFLSRRHQQRWRGYGVQRMSPRSPKRVASLLDTKPSFEDCTENVRPALLDPPSSPHRSQHLQVSSPQHSRSSRDP
jgi:hypothetical protein